MKWKRSIKKIRWRIYNAAPLARLSTAPKANQIFFFLLLNLLLFLPIDWARGEEPPFTIETLTGQKAHVPLGVSTTGESLLIAEPISLPTPCHWIGAKVTRQNFQIVVKLQTKENLSSDRACAQVIVPAVARLTLPHLPNGVYSILIEAPQKTTRATATISP